MRAAAATARPWRLVFSTSLLVGVVQVALIRELSAYHALSSVDLSIRLVIAVVIAAHGVGAALAPGIRRVGEQRALVWLGGAMAIYLCSMLLAALWWLEPELSARAVDAPRLLLLGALVSPPFIACGMIVTHVTANVQRQSPGRVGAFIGMSLLGTLVGVILSHHYAQYVGVNSLMILAACCAVPLLLDRNLMAVVAAVVVTALPLESWLESERESRPDFYAPVTADNTTRVFSGWSPHQKVDLYTFRDEVLLGCYNGFWQWWSAARTDHPNAFPGYDLLYDSQWMKGSDVLVIGSGAGMGLLHLEASAPATITAVELDPLVVDLAKGRFAAFNDHIYDRVEVHAMDGRSFLEAPGELFDVIIYEGSFLTATHPRVAVSVENYLYTREGIRAALARLRPGGLGIALYAGPDRAFARVQRAIESEGVAVAALHLMYEGTLWRDLPALVFSRDAARVQEVYRHVLAGETGIRAETEEGTSRVGRGGPATPAGSAGPYRVDLDGVEPITDNRPFLYAGKPGELLPLALLVLAGIAALLVGLAVPGRRALRGYYFLIGLAFVLVQYGVVSTFRSFFGDPVSTAYAVVLLLLAGMAVGSAQLSAFLGRPAKQRWALAAVALTISVAALAWLPVDLAFSPAPVRLGVAALAVLPGAILLGVFFPLGLRGQPPEAVATAYIFDALGTVVGFLLFYLIALQSGISAAPGVGVLAYCAAWVVLRRT